MAPHKPTFALLATALVALAAAPPADASDPDNWPSILDGHSWGCGGVAPATLTCSGSTQEIGKYLNIGVQYCHGSLNDVCNPGDLMFQGTVTVRVSSSNGSWRMTCHIDADGIPQEGHDCTEVHSGLRVGDVASLTGSVQATCGHCPGGAPAGYWRVWAETRN